MSRNAFAAALIVISIAAALRIAATHSVFAPTWDEPTHVYGGWDYLNNHRVEWTDHPPLARITFAFPLRKAIVNKESGIDIASQVYLSAGDYMKGVAQSRRGNLLFVVIAIVATAVWTNAMFGPVTGIVAALIMTMLPQILAHGGLATTDMAATASFALAMLAFHHFIAKPDWPRTALLGAAFGFGLVSKFSFPPFCAIAGIVLLIAARKSVTVGTIARLLVALVIGFSIVWLAYFQEHGRMYRSRPDARTMALKLFGSDWIATGPRLPAPMFFYGMLEVAYHNHEGHGSYAFGRVRSQGIWYYFPTLLAVKTPITVLLLAAAGAWLTFRHRRHRELVIIVAALLAFAMRSHINIGIRHILPIYVVISILAAYAFIEGWRARAARPLMVALAAWLVVGSIVAHPDYLPWANAFGGRHPEHIALDSNFDWGQDALRLRDECRRRGITAIGIDLFGDFDLPSMGFPATHKVDRHVASNGWIALSEHNLLSAQAQDPDNYRWITEPFSFQRIGKTIRLYHVPGEGK